MFTLPGGDADRVSTDLLSGYDAAEGIAPVGPTSGDIAPVLTPMTDAQGRVEVNITTGDPASLAPLLTGLGVNVVATLPKYHRIEAYVPWSALPAVSDLGGQGLMGVVGVEKPLTSVGLVTSQGVNVLEADRVQAGTAGTNGTGVTVGVLSDSFNNLGGAATDEANNDLTPTVNVIQDIPGGGADEGRAMLQIVHDVAPGAPLAFATADVSESGFASNIQALANAGAKVIADDITYFDEPYFQDGIVAQAVNNVVTSNGVAYFAAAGNIDTQAYDSASPLAYGSNPIGFVTDTIGSVSGSPQSYYNFNAGGGTPSDKQTFTLGSGQGIILGLQWDQPYYTTSGVTTQLNFYILNHNTGQVVAQSTTNTIANQTPFQLVGFQNTGGGSNQYDIVIEDAAGPAPGRLKYENFGSNDYGDVTFNTFATNSPTMNPHAGAAGAVAVGADPYFNQKSPESFSSFGPTTILFDPSGNRLAAPQVRAKSDVTAPDGADTTLTSLGGDVDTSGFPNFFGTSAATPHAAGVAALYLQAHPGSTPAQVASALKASADPNIGTGNVNQVGAGLIDAETAVVGNPVPAAAPFSDGFESGALGPAWQVYQSGAGRTLVTTANGPSNGADHLVLDSLLQDNNPGAFFNLPSLSDAVLHLNLPGRSGVALTFNEKAFTSANDPAPVAMPATFTGHSNSDGVALSVDGVHWFQVVSLTGANSTATYQTETFNLSQVAAANGLTLGPDTQIKFQRFDSRALQAPNSGIAIDNVNITSQNTLQVTQFTPTASGFAVRFNRAIDANVLSLYQTSTDPNSAGPADATLTGNTNGPVAGSIVVDPDGQGFTFLATAGALPTDTYTVTLRSNATNGVRDAAGGSALDGTGSGTPGSNYTTTFTTTGGRSIGVPAFVRGPGQPVAVPVTGAGVPVRLSDATGVQSASFTVHFDPARLTVTGASADPSMPVGTTVTSNLTAPGTLTVTVTSSAPLPAGPAALVDLAASVPATAPYTSKEVVSVGQVALTDGSGNPVAAAGYGSVHVVDDLGDASGNGLINGFDSTLVQRYILGLDAGLGAFKDADPALIGDVSGNGIVNGFDRTLLQQYILGQNPPQIPAIPNATVTQGGPDPVVALPRGLVVAPGGALSVPVGLAQTSAGAVGLQSFDLAIAYDPSAFRVAGVRAGSLASGFDLLWSTAVKPGLLVISASRVAGPVTLAPGASGTLALIDLVALPGARPGASALRLVEVAYGSDGPRATLLDDGRLTVTTADGSVTVLSGGGPVAVRPKGGTATATVTPAGRPAVPAGPLAAARGKAGLTVAPALTRARALPAQAGPDRSGGLAVRPGQA